MFGGGQAGVNRALSDGQNYTEHNYEQELLPFFPPGSGEANFGGTKFEDNDFFEITQILARGGRRSWSRLPRTYTILRVIGALEYFDQIIRDKSTDLAIPYTKDNLPSCLPPNMRAQFYSAQNIVLSGVLELEQGYAGHHCHILDRASLQFITRANLAQNRASGTRVEKVYSSLSGRTFVLKTIRRKGKFYMDRETLTNFEAELNAAKKVKHDHIAVIAGSFTSPTQVGIVIATVGDCDLRTFLDGQIDADRKSLLRTWYGCLASGLLALHDAQIRHKDIKPENILIKNSKVFYTDFGIALDWSEKTRATTTGRPLLFSPRFCSPEVANWDGRNESSDIWSLGAVYLEMVTRLHNMSISEFRRFLDTHGEHTSSQYCRNVPGLRMWISELQARDSSSENNLPLPWISECFKDREAPRPTARKLWEMIDEDTYSSKFSYACEQCHKTHESSDSDTSSEMEQTSSEYPAQASQASIKSVPFPTPTGVVQLLDRNRTSEELLNTSGFPLLQHAVQAEDSTSLSDTTAVEEMAFQDSSSQPAGLITEAISRLDSRKQNADIVGSINKPSAPGLHVLKHGGIADDEGYITGYVTKGDLRSLQGLAVTQDGHILDKRGRITGYANLLDGAVKEGENMFKGIFKFPNAGFLALRVGEEGEIRSEDGIIVGIVVIGNLTYLTGLSVDEDGQIIDNYGHVKGQAKPLTSRRTRRRYPTLTSSTAETVGNERISERNRSLPNYKDSTKDDSWYANQKGERALFPSNHVGNAKTLARKIGLPVEAQQAINDNTQGTQKGAEEATENRLRQKKETKRQTEARQLAGRSRRKEEAGIRRREKIQERRDQRRWREEEEEARVRAEEGKIAEPRHKDEEDAQHVKREHIVKENAEMPPGKRHAQDRNGKSRAESFKEEVDARENSSVLADSTGHSAAIVQNTEHDVPLLSEITDKIGRPTLVPSWTDTRKLPKDHMEVSDTIYLKVENIEYEATKENFKILFEAFPCSVAAWLGNTSGFVQVLYFKEIESFIRYFNVFKFIWKKVIMYGTADSEIEALDPEGWFQIDVHDPVSPWDERRHNSILKGYPEYLENEVFPKFRIVNTNSGDGFKREIESGSPQSSKPPKPKPSPNSPADNNTYTRPSWQDRFNSLFSRKDRPPHISTKSDVTPKGSDTTSKVSDHEYRQPQSFLHDGSSARSQPPLIASGHSRASTTVSQPISTLDIRFAGGRNYKDDEEWAKANHLGDMLDMRRYDNNLSEQRKYEIRKYYLDLISKVRKEIEDQLLLKARAESAQPKSLLDTENSFETKKRQTSMIERGTQSSDLSNEISVGITNEWDSYVLYRHQNEEDKLPKRHLVKHPRPVVSHSDARTRRIRETEPERMRSPHSTRWT